jgi:hypothetical protein
MRWQVSSFYAQKAGNLASEYEDAFWVPQSADVNSVQLRIALADGATETSFAGLWAKLLVRAYGRERLICDDVFAGLDDCRRTWNRIVTSKQLPWYGEEKVRLGASSSFLGLTVTQDGQASTWQAVAVGDSCLFHVRGKELLTSFPIDHSNSFTSRPFLLSSIRREDSDDEQRVEHVTGGCAAGDAFYLMTDALACWFLKCWEVHVDALDWLRALNTQEDFERWISQVRQDSLIDGTPVLKNDDVTFVACCLT